MKMKIFGSIKHLRDSVSHGLSEHVMPWYGRLQPREQKLVGFAAVALPAMLLIFGVLLPIQDTVKRLQYDVGTLAVQADEARQLADRLQKQGGVRKHPAGNLMSVIERAAQQTKVRSYIARIRPEAGFDHRQQMQVHMKQAPYAEVVRFLGRLRGDGLNVVRAKLDALDQPGLVDAELTLTTDG